VSYVPHVVAWNLTRRCNLECAHCYISAGPRESATSELETEDCLRIVDELLAVNPAPMLILSGGEPLLRHDLTQIAAYASQRGATVVVGTNGTLLTDERIAGLRAAGVRGVAVSVDSLRPAYHDRFRHGPGSLDDALAALGRLRAHRLDFLIQTTATKGNRAELERLAQWSAEQGAVAFNCYFLVATGRGAGLSDLAPAEYEAVLADLTRWQRQYRGQMMVRAKCAPHFMRHVHVADPQSPILNYQTRCPCGTQYCRITPDGKLTPCPYLPEVAGDLRAQSFGEIWRSSPLFRQTVKERSAANAGLRISEAVRRLSRARVRARGRCARGRSFVHVRATSGRGDRAAQRELRHRLHPRAHLVRRGAGPPRSHSVVRARGRCQAS
jgi:MoaA/NifB/PqqE/SkfB family radical SAM enzyme